MSFLLVMLPLVVGAAETNAEPNTDAYVKIVESLMVATVTPKKTGLARERERVKSREAV